MWENDLLKPIVFHREYRGLESVVAAMTDLNNREVCGKAVISMDINDRKAHL
jgi:hypothetical protein